MVFFVIVTDGHVVGPFLFDAWVLRLLSWFLPTPRGSNLTPLSQANAKQWESLEPAVKLWTERDSEAPRNAGKAKATERRSSGGGTGTAGSGSNGGDHHQQQQEGDPVPGAPGASDTPTRIYEEAASLLAHNRAVLGQALARSGATDEGIKELEVACPEILEYQQNAQGRRDSKSETRSGADQRGGVAVVRV